MQNVSRKHCYFDPLRDELKEVVWILNDELLNELHFPEWFPDEQIIIIIIMLGEACSTKELRMTCM